MKKPHVLNRPMFKTGGTSAYGRGITSNLVSDEQRQRFNDGGRVGLRWGTGRSKVRPIRVPPIGGPYPETGVFPPVGRGYPVYDYQDLSYEEIPSNIATMPYNVEGISTKPYKIGEVTSRQSKRSPSIEPTKYGDIFARGYVGQGYKDPDQGDEVQESVDISNMNLDEAREIGREDDWWRMEKGDVFTKAAKGDDEGYESLTTETWTDDEGKQRAQQELTAEERLIGVRAHDADPAEKIQQQIKKEEDAKLLTGDDLPQSRRLDTELLDIESIIDKYYKPKAALGEGLFGLAGTVLTASQQSKKEAAKTLGTGLGQFGKTLAAQKKEKSKLGATLEGQREIYRQSRIAKGEQDRLTEDHKAKLKAEGADREDISNLEKYMKLSAWDTDKLGPLTGDKHRDFIATIDPAMAEKVIVMEQQTTGTGKDQTTGFSQFAVDAYKDAAEGDPIVIGDGKLYIKDSSAPAVGNTPEGMREVGYWEYQKSLGKKDKKLNVGEKILEEAGVYS